MTLPRVTIIHTGGTFGMVPQAGSALAPGPHQVTLLQSAPELERLARIRLIAPFNRDSSSLEATDVLELARIIAREADDCEGLVVVHGTDTMAFTVSVLGFVLADLGKPVILTGSQRPLAFVRSDARTNLVDAVSLAVSGIPEVGICFGDQWIRGVASDKTSVDRYQAFESPNLPPLAELGLHIRIHPHAGRFQRRVPEGFRDAFLPTVAVYTPHPGFAWHLPPPGTRALLIQAYGAGNLPMQRRDLRELLAHARHQRMPVVVTTQCASGGVDLDAYELGHILAGEGAISGGLHTRWAALAKLGLLLGGGGDLEAARAAFAQSWAGEPMPPR